MTIRLKSVAIAAASAWLIGTAAAACSTGTSDAQGTAGVLGPLQESTTITSVFAVNEAEFLRLDVNRDGRLSRDEVGGDHGLQRDWQRIDLDADGYLTRDELARFHAAGGTATAGNRPEGSSAR